MPCVPFNPQEHGPKFIIPAKTSFCHPAHRPPLCPIITVIIGYASYVTVATGSHNDNGAIADISRVRYQ